MTSDDLKICQCCKKLYPLHMFPRCELYVSKENTTEYKPHICEICNVPGFEETRYVKTPPLIKNVTQVWVDAIWDWRNLVAVPTECEAFDELVESGSLPDIDGEFYTPLTTEVAIVAHNVIEKVRQDIAAPEVKPKIEMAGAISGSKQCAKCTIVKDASEFGMKRGKLAPYCKACNRAITQASKS